MKRAIFSNRALDPDARAKLYIRKSSFDEVALWMFSLE